MERYNSCSKCDEEVTEESPLYRKYVLLLNHMFPPLEATDVPDAEENEEENVGIRFAGIPVTIRVITLGGDEKEIQSTLNRKIKDFKDDIEREFGVEPRQQKLLFNEKELEVSWNKTAGYFLFISLYATLLKNRLSGIKADRVKTW